MTLLEYPRISGETDLPSQTANEDEQEQVCPLPVNVGNNERAVSAAAGAILVVQGLSRMSLPGLLCAGVGGALLIRGATGHCPAYSALGVDKAHAPGEGELSAEVELAERGVRVEQTFLINRSPADLYRHWRNFENLPSIMSHLERVTVTDDRHSHWVAKAPRIAGGQVEWDAEITDDEPDALIAWRSLAGADVDNAGRVTFAKAMGDRGTEVHVSMSYVPPAGKLGDWIAKLFGKSAKQQIREDLRTFKSIMEVGEAPTTEGQSHGACARAGRGSSNDSE